MEEDKKGEKREKEDSDEFEVISAADVREAVFVSDSEIESQGKGYLPLSATQCLGLGATARSTLQTTVATLPNIGCST